MGIEIRRNGNDQNERLASLAWKKVEDVLLEHHHNPDLEAARVICATFAAHRLDGPPVWTMNVAPPGSMKTELLMSFDGQRRVHIIDQITPNTFISGQIADPKHPNKTPSSLLHRIGQDGILIYPDFSTVLSMKLDHRASVLADMRRIYDGQLRKEYGTSDAVAGHEWVGRITCLVAATPDVDGYYSIFQTLGERFVIVRSSRPGGIEAALKAMNQDTKKAKQALRAAIHSLFRELPVFEPMLRRNLQLKIAALAEFAVRGRTQVPRDGYNKSIVYVPEPEAATRLSQQLAQLVKGSALLARRQEADENDYRLGVRVAFDSIPATKRKILDACIAGGPIAQLKMPQSTRRYAEEDLECQGLLDGGKLSDLVLDLLGKAGIRR